VLAAVTTAAVVLAMAAGPFRVGPGPAAGGGPAAPRQFNPVSPYVSFGWLPAGESLYSGENRPTQVFLAAGPRGGLPRWNLSVYARGQCHFTPPPRALQCPYQGADATSARLKITGSAAAVDGRRAFWASAGLVWQYARDGWATLTWPGYAPGAPRGDQNRRARPVRCGHHAAAVPCPAHRPGRPVADQRRVLRALRPGAARRFLHADHP